MAAPAPSTAPSTFARGKSDKISTSNLAFPNLDPLEDVCAMLAAADGACGIVASSLDGAASVGTDSVHAVYAIGYVLIAARGRLLPVLSDLVAYKNAVSDGDH